MSELISGRVTVGRLDVVYLKSNVDILWIYFNVR